MKSYPFVYKIKVFIFEEEETHYGVGFCSSFADAASKIEQSYSFDELISIEHLELLEEDNLLQVSKDYYEKIKMGFTSDELYKN